MMLGGCPIDDGLRVLYIRKQQSKLLEVHDSASHATLEGCRYSYMSTLMVGGSSCRVACLLFPQYIK